MNNLKRNVGLVFALAILALVLSIKTSAFTPTTYAAFPGKNSKIAFQHCGAESCEIWVMEPDGSNKAMLTRGLSPSWSPDGSRIAYVSSGIWRMDADGSNQVRLTNGYDYSPSWCSNNKIAFESHRDGDREIYTVDADGNNEMRLTFEPENDGNPACSPDGKQIAFASRRIVPEGGIGEIYKMNVDGSNLVRLTNVFGNKGNPNWSPDGQKLVLRLSSQIWKMDANGDNLERLTFNTGYYDSNPAWSPDGNKIVYASSRPYPNESEIYVMNPDGSNEERLTYNPTYRDTDPDWQPITPEALERAALVAFYHSTNGDSWASSNGWLDETVSHCDWRGVECDVEGRVERLILYNNQLSGSIPPEVGNLRNLQRLDLVTNELSGSIPSELGKLSKLVFLELWGNQLTGSIPPELGNLSKLKYLMLHNNKLSGPIPSELNALSILEYLYLGFNELSGSIPPELGNLSKLRTLYLANNELSGPIPSELGNLGNLLGLYLEGNQLVCWETRGVLQWAKSFQNRLWDYPNPGEFVCTDINPLLGLPNVEESYDPTPADNAPAGTYTIRTTFLNSSNDSIEDILFQVAELSGRNLLLNADSGPGGAGSLLSVPPASLGDDGNGVLEPGESFTVDFEIGLQRLRRFIFYVDGYGTLIDGSDETAISVDSLTESKSWVDSVGAFETERSQGKSFSLGISGRQLRMDLRRARSPQWR